MLNMLQEFWVFTGSWIHLYYEVTITEVSFLLNTSSI
jgi:hypothetical protein